LNLGRLNISLTPGVAHHSVQQVLLQFPLLHLRQLVEELM
jgi:hypothetical protein